MNINLTRHFPALRVLGKSAVLAAAICTSAASWADFDPQRAWTTVASAGTVDESNVDSIKFHLNYAYPAKNENNFSSGKIRYNVTAADNLFFGPFPIMTMTYTDRGDSSQVKARLIKVDLENGAGKTILTFDSNDFPQSTRRQQQQVTDKCDTLEPFDFGKFAYYVEVAMSQDNRTNDRASLETIQLSTKFCVS